MSNRLITNRSRSLRVAAFVAATFAPASAFAEGAGMSSDAFQTLLTLIAVIGVAYIVAHVFSEYISKRWGIVTGAEYILVGAAVGPGLALLDTGLVDQLSPAIILAEGSLGLLAGILFHSRVLNGRVVRIGAVISVITFAMVAGVPLLIGNALWGVKTLDYLPHIMAIGAIATVADLAPVRTLIDFLKARGEGVEVIQNTSVVASGIAIAIFGVIFCLFKPASDLFPSLTFGPGQSVLFWLGVHVTIGVLLGAIFALFLVADYDDDKILTVVIGMVIFTAGVAYYMKLSPIFVCFMLGASFTHLCPQRQHVLEMLESINRPLYIAIYFFLGASLSFDVAWWAALLAVPYFVLRHIGRGLGGVVAQQVGMPRQLPPIGRALWAPGALSAAMALNFINVYDDVQYANEVFFGLVVVILLSEPIAYRFTRIWLIDATDVALVREGDR